LLQGERLYRIARYAYFSADLLDDLVRTGRNGYHLFMMAERRGTEELLHLDGDQLKWRIARQREGLTISRAAEPWNSLEATGQDPLRTSTALAAPSTDSHTPLQLQHAWIEARLAFDESRAEAVLALSFALFAPERVCLDVIQQGLASLGTECPRLREWFAQYERNLT